MIYRDSGALWTTWARPHESSKLDHDVKKQRAARAKEANAAKAGSPSGQEVAIAGAGDAPPAQSQD